MEWLAFWHLQMKLTCLVQIAVGTSPRRDDTVI